ncbi:hypothetical protein [Curtobacterium sp. 9128]|uniref:hypothetical protein n=1 Tax=Curtobacterium sp. 9128 TaxID=1793722 RepID=UPI0011A54252|nr:hypothetical protein [Curtobacterium sp. 9128]
MNRPDSRTGRATADRPTRRLRAATAVWRGRQPRDIGDRAYLAYAIVLAALVLGAPVVRALWLRLTTDATSAALVSSAAATTAGTVALTVWAVALFVGRHRGPAVAAPFLVHVLAGSDLPRRTVFRARVTAAVGVAAVVAAALAGFVGAALATRGLVDPPAVLDFAVRAALIGVVAAVCWLFGEARPRTAGAVAVVLLVAAAAQQVVPVLHGTTWAWFRAAGPVDAVDAVLLVLAVVALAAAPWLLDRIDDATLAVQAARWDRAIAHAVSLDLTSVAESYQALPTVGRRLDAVVGSARLGVVIVVRDLVGALRVPGRLASGIVLVAGAGALVALAAVVPVGGVVLGGLAAAVLFSGVGAFGRGLQHAALVTTGTPLYGIGDGRLLGLHSLLPTGAALLLTGGTAVAVGAVVAPGALGVVVWGGVALPLVVVAAHLSNALRGPAPLFLTTPVSSPVGDPMPLVRVLWAMDAPVLAVLAGSALSAGAAGVGAVVVVIVVLALFLLVRWVRRADR